MPRTTRLYQRARSPLIQGRSRRERPWAADCAVACGWGVAVLVVLTLAGAASEAGSVGAGFEALSRDVGSLLGGVVAIAAAGVVSVSVSRAWGAAKPGRTGAFVCCAVSVAYWTLVGGVGAARR